MGSKVTVGAKAPGFTLPRDGGGEVSLAEFRGRKLVLYFYPKADTPACTTEGQDFSTLIKSFDEAGAVVIGVSRDPVKKLDRFKAKYDLKVILASDEPEDVTEAFGVWVQKKLYGRDYMGIERATFLIDGAGVVRCIWRKVSVKNHAAEVLTAVRSL